MLFFHFCADLGFITLDQPPQLQFHCKYIILWSAVLCVNFLQLNLKIKMMWGQIYSDMYVRFINFFMQMLCKLAVELMYVNVTYRW